MKYSLGAVRNPIRELPEYQLASIVYEPKVLTDISHIPVLNQGQQPACVGHAFACALMYDYWKKTGIVPSISPRFIYSRAKLIDGDPTGEGTSAYFAFTGVKDAGGAALTDTVPNIITLSVTDYQTVIITDNITKQCIEYPILNDVEVTNPTDAQLQSLIAQYGVIIVALTVDENSWMFEDGKQTLLPGTAGGHEVALFGYDATIPGTQYSVRNSWDTTWGTNGNGTLLYSNYQGNIYDAMSITIDMNNPIITNTVTITRKNSDAKETLGTLVAGSFTCDTLEKPWLNNAQNISCIPTGTYQALWTYQHDLNEYHYCLQGVTGRSGIFIHEGNYYTNTQGCILLGSSEADINGDDELDVVSSRATLAEFEALYNKQPITVIIK